MYRFFSSVILVTVLFSLQQPILAAPTADLSIRQIPYPPLIHPPSLTGVPFAGDDCVNGDNPWSGFVLSEAPKQERRDNDGLPEATRVLPGISFHEVHRRQDSNTMCTQVANFTFVNWTQQYGVVPNIRLDGGDTAYFLSISSTCPIRCVDPNAAPVGSDQFVGLGQRYSDGSSQTTTTYFSLDSPHDVLFYIFFMCNPADGAVLSGEVALFMVPRCADEDACIYEAV